MSLLIVGLDVTIVNVALPAIRDDLHASVPGLQWTIDAYTLVLATLLMLSGSMGDRFGRRRTFQIGLAVFTLGSLLCGLAPSLGWLVAFRMLQAIGGSMLNPVALSIVSNTFPDPAERARALGVWTGVFGLSLALGPVLGGLFVDTVGWRVIFLANIPIGLAALLLTALFVPESKAARGRRMDPVGQVLVIMLLSAVTYAIIEGRGLGWGSPAIIGIFVLSAVMLAGLLYYEPRRPEPLLELRFFRSVPFSGATVIAVSAFGAMGAFLFLNTIYLQSVRGLSPLHAGLCMLPMAVMMAVGGPLAGRLLSRRGPRPLLVTAGIALMAGGAMLTVLTGRTSLAWLLAAYVVFGIGISVVNPPITNNAVSGMPRAQAGLAAAVTSTSRQVGSTLGVAIAGSIALHGTTVSPAGWWLIVGYGAAVLIMAFVTTNAWARRTAGRAAGELAELEADQSKIIVSG